MVSPFSICYDIYTKEKTKHYYDTLAFISNNNYSYKNNDNTCLFKKCKRCVNHRKNKNIKINEEYLLDSNNLIYVKSCFGSMSLLKTDIYNKVKWGDSICEHHSFCEEILKYGKIAINPQIETFTTIPTLTDYKKIQNILEEL